MPRVTFQDFYLRHRELKKAWDDPISYFLSLEPHEQWYLHDYYRPSEKLTKQELRAHWQTLHDKPTPLHQQAGRVYARLKPFLEGGSYDLVPPEKRATSTKNAEVVVRGIVNPKLDVDLAVETVLMSGKQLIDEDETQYSAHNKMR